MLEVIEEEKRASLFDRMDDAGCAFKFLLLAPGSDVAVDELVHRQALGSLHEMLMRDSMEWYNDLMKDPEYKGSFDPSISWEPHKAVATVLNKEEIHDLTLVGEVMGDYALYSAFRQPVYSTSFKGGEVEAQTIFHEWLQFLGLEEQHGIVVINWVKGLKFKSFDNDDAIPGRESWSDYFDAGLEWWGVWCLTIWNPKRRTLSALIASTTD